MLDELVEWTIFIATGKKGVISKLNQLEMLKLKINGNIKYIK